MPKLELTEDERRNILVFLNRVDLKGAEAKPFMMVVAKLENAREGE